LGPSRANLTIKYPGFMEKESFFLGLSSGRLQFHFMATTHLTCPSTGYLYFFIMDLGATFNYYAFNFWLPLDA